MRKLNIGDMLKKKGQSAMEYLMTYGWAILIVIVVVAALYAMGVFKGGATVACSPCFGGSDIAYVDHNDSHVLLRAGPRKITVGGTEQVPGSEWYEDLTTQGCASGWLTCDLTVTYTAVDSGMSHQLTASIHQ